MSCQKIVLLSHHHRHNDIIQYLSFWSNIMRWLSVILGCILFASHGHADPCGMVPPAFVSDAEKDNAIARTGIQRTYVMHKDGIETMVLHPEFTGKIDDFGMLIPFPFNLNCVSD